MEPITNPSLAISSLSVRFRVVPEAVQRPLMAEQEKARNLVRMTEKRHLGSILTAVITTYWTGEPEYEPINSSISTLFSQKSP